ncbi:hypothetical protein HPB50_029134 [Hyalomma asiaticum]|nr:hypothetical protein HPB50_029134 [Hyalomma asiaticum]
MDAFFSLTNSRACGVGVIFVSGRFRKKSHCTFEADGRMIMLDVYIEGRRVRFVDLYAPLTRSDTKSFSEDLGQLLLEPLPHVLLGDFNCVMDSQRYVSGPGQSGSTYQAKELVKILRHLSLTDVWVHLHNDHFGPTRLSKTSASRIARTYLPDYLLISVVECEVVDLPGNLSGKSDQLPLATTVRGSPGFSSRNLGWRLDPSLLHDEVCVQCVRDGIRESLENVPSLTPHVWDKPKEGWKKLLQEEGRDRKRRLSAQMGEILRRMPIVKEAESLISCTREYLETLQATYTQLLQLKTRRRAKEPDPPDSSTDPGSRDVYGNGAVRITEAKRLDGSMTSDPGEIADIFREYFSSQFHESDSAEENPNRMQISELCQNLRRPGEEELTDLCCEASMEELCSAIRNMPSNSAPGSDGLKAVDRIGSLGEERRDGEIEGITARRLRLAAPPVTAASAALRLWTRRKPEHPIALYDGDEARLV